MLKSKIKNEKGFTLLEILVSVAIFSLVLVATMGAILTVLDANRKARTVVEAMNNLNFAMESITRSIKTGVNPVNVGGTSAIAVKANDLGSGDFTREHISYKLDGGQILRCVNTILDGVCDSGDSWVPLTSKEIVIEGLTFKISNTTDFNQPKVLVNVRGKVEANEHIYSRFHLQTTISQRDLNIQGDES